MPHRHLPKNPSLRHLRDQARDLMRGHKSADPAALQRIREFHPEFRDLTDGAIVAKTFRLSDAQHTIAREYLFESWPKLKALVECGTTPDESLPLIDRIPDAAFRDAVRCIDAGDVDGLRRHLLERPTLVRQHVYFNAGDYFGRPGLLQFVAQNPIRQESMPNAVEIAELILGTGTTVADKTDALGLVATGRVPRENRVQVPLIDLLCRCGARIECMISVLAHGEFEAAEALIGHGSRVSLPVAAAFGWEPEFESLLREASVEDRHLALAFAAQFGRLTILERLLERGEDPNRYNPPGAHAHSTPLHQAAIHGHADVVRALRMAGARADIPDTLFGGTAQGWAEHAKLPAMVALLAEPSVL